MIIVNELKLSKRLQTVAKYITKGAVVADIGSDHAYLPCYCVLNRLASAAIAGEITDGPFLSAKQQVEKLQLSPLISVRKGDGLEVIEKGEADVITIAGMGGSLIAHILKAGKDKLSGKERLVLQPNIHAHHIREWLYQEGYALINEEFLCGRHACRPIFGQTKKCCLYQKMVARTETYGKHLSTN